MKVQNCLFVFRPLKINKLISIRLQPFAIGHLLTDSIIFLCMLLVFYLQRTKLPENKQTLKMKNTNSFTLKSNCS